MSISLKDCVVCDVVFEPSTYSEECPVCKLRAEMQDKIDDLHELIRNFHPLE